MPESVTCVVQINCIAPGSTSTDMTNNLPEDVKAGIKATIPNGRIATVQEVVAARVTLE